MNFELDKDKYTLSHALFWGNSKAHFNKASDTSLHWKGRVVHGFISFVEAIPLVGQVVSLIEYMCAKVILAKPISIKTGDMPVANVKNAEDHLQTMAKEKQEETYRPNINAQNALNEMKTLLKDGFIVDRDFVLNNYPKFEQVASGENTDELRALVNNTYLDHLQQRIESGALSIPKSLIALLGHNGIKANLDAVKQKMLEAIQTLPKDALKAKEPVTLLSEVQTVLIDCICKELQLPVGFKSDFEACLQLEQHWTSTRAHAKEFMHTMLMPTIEELINGKTLSAEEKTFYLQKIAEELPRCIPDKLQTDLEFVLKSTDTETTLKQRVDTKIASITEPKIQKYLMQKAVGILENAQDEWRAANDWKIKFNCEHVIKFSQGADDINQILGDGCCFAINIKWGKALGELGTKKIHSLEQLTRRHPYSVDPVNLEQLKGLFNVALVEKYKEKATVSPLNSDFDDPIARAVVVEEDDGDGVSRNDRFIQARYRVERALERKADLTQTKELLKKDGYIVVESKVNPQISVVENIKELNRATGGTFDPIGFIDIGIYEDGSLSSHAIGCKIDHGTKRYLFWDPNYGVFKANTFDDFCNAFEAFLKENYSNWKPYLLRDVHK